MESHNLKIVAQLMGAALRGYWREAESYQKFAYSVGIMLLASALFHACVLVVTGGSLRGNVSWRKPILFGEAFGLTAISLSWILTYLPKRLVAAWLLLGTIGTAYIYEVFWVSMQQWRGVPSHFNGSTPFDSAVALMAGIMISFSGIGLIAVTVWSFLSLQAPTSLKLAIRAGLVSLLAGQFFGFVMIRNDSHTVGAAGTLKIPHALALHGLQVLAALAWLLLFADRSESQRTRAVVWGILAYSGLVAISAYQTFSGHAPVDLRFPAALTLAACALGLTAVFVWTLSALSASALSPSVIRPPLREQVK